MSRHLSNDRAHSGCAVGCRQRGRVLHLIERCGTAFLCTSPCRGPDQRVMRRLTWMRTPVTYSRSPRRVISIAPVATSERVSVGP